MARPPDNSRLAPSAPGLPRTGNEAIAVEADPSATAQGPGRSPSAYMWTVVTPSSKGREASLPAAALSGQRRTARPPDRWRGDVVAHIGDEGIGADHRATVAEAISDDHILDLVSRRSRSRRGSTEGDSSGAVVVDLGHRHRQGTPTLLWPAAPPTSAGDRGRSTVDRLVDRHKLVADENPLQRGDLNVLAGDRLRCAGRCRSLSSPRSRRRLCRRVTLK